MAAIFTYGFAVSKERFEAANIDVITLSNYENLLQKAVDKRYVSERRIRNIERLELESSRMESRSINLYLNV